MDIMEFRDYCLSLPLTEKTTPFDEVTLVYKIGGKMYAVCDMENFDGISLKARPEDVVGMCEAYPSVIPAPHFNKKHWVKIAADGGVTDDFMRRKILESYFLVIGGLPKAPRLELQDYLARNGFHEPGRE